MDSPPTTVVHPIGAQPHAPRPANVTGLIGLCMVAVATVLSPTGFLGITLCVLVPLGFGGLAVCAASLAWRPRWPGVCGLAIGLACVAFWVCLFGWPLISGQRHAARFGLTLPQHTQLCMTACILCGTAESQRAAAGTTPGVFTLGTLNPRDQLDPWGRPCRYVLASTPRGFTFMSDGPDGVASTADDIDLLTIQDGLTFSLPPIGAGTPPAPPGP